MGQLGLQRQPSQRQVLEAHIEALFERYAPQTAMTGSLVVRPTGGQYRVVVEAGLSRVEVEARTTRLAAIIVPLDAFLMHSPLGANVEVEQRLREQQLERRPGSGALEVLVTAEGPRAFSDMAARIEGMLEALFDRGGGDFYAVSIEREMNPANEELLELVRVLVRRKDMESRRQVYQAVVNGRFWLPLREAAGDQLLPVVEGWPEPFHGAPVWAVFTDLEALKDYRDNVQPAVVVTGVRLVQALHVYGVGALKINPSSKVGGELYGNEIETLANYLRARGLLSPSSPLH